MQTRCRFCGGESSDALVTEDRNRGLSDEHFGYRRCAHCKTIFISEIPGDLGRYYPEDAYAIPAGRHRELAVASERWRVELLNRFIEPGRLVEIGPGFGIFADGAVSAGFDVHVIDMDSHATERLGTHTGITATASDDPAKVLRTLPPSRAVVLWHSLEHLPDPAGTLTSAAENLEPGGLLALATPNPDSLQFRLLGAHWLHLDAPRHLCLIPRHALLARARELGLTELALTTADPTGLQCNRAGWQWAGRRPLARHEPSFVWTVFTAVLTRALTPIERHGLHGSTYTVVFEKHQASPSARA